MITDTTNILCRLDGVICSAVLGDDEGGAAGSGCAVGSEVAGWGSLFINMIVAYYDASL
jgi:hypothetical protein